MDRWTQQSNALEPHSSLREESTIPNIRTELNPFCTNSPINGTRTSTEYLF